MLKSLVNKGKNNKGFTLIELIVVIAIIGILALILVPRFAGFTDTARNNANASTMKTIETGITSLLANGTITGKDGTIKINNDGTITISGSGSEPIKDTNIETHLEALIGTNYQNQTGTYFEVTIDDREITKIEAK